MTASATIRLLSVAQLAALWGVSKEYVYEEIRAGRLTKTELGNGDRDKVRVTEAEATRWVQDRTHGRAS